MGDRREVAGRGIMGEGRKFVDQGAALPIVGEAHNEGEVIVFTNGCFDLIHVGHVCYLEQARELGDLLVVGINTDDSVRQIKGSGRPINPLGDRARVLSGLASVNLIVPFDDPDPYRLICAIQPDILAKGSDWPEDAIVGRDVVESRGGRVVRLPLRQGISTTIMIQRILAAYAAQPLESRPGPPGY